MGAWEPHKTGPVFAKWNPAVKNGDNQKESQLPDHLRVFFYADAFFNFMNGDT